MGQKMRNAPVYYTVAQARHNPILSLETYIPTIQENLRLAGYPDYQHSVVMSFNLSAVGATPPQPQVQQVKRHVFSNADATAGFLLQPDSISFQVTDYDTFETFSKEFLKGLEILHAAVGLSFVERLGLRYLDAVLPKDGEDLNKYIAPELTGLPALMKNADFSHSFSEALMVMPEIGRVMSRVIIQGGALGFPPDLQPDPLKVALRFKAAKGPHAVIDTDGFYEVREAYDKNKIGKRLDQLHDGINATFAATATKFAKDAWK